VEGPDRPVLSFVLPAHNEAGNLEKLGRRLVQVGEDLGRAFEIIWVNDGSTDRTESILETMAARDGRIRPIHLSRNFGHMAALTAGLESARATGAVVCLDSDGQHPPELIPDMVARWQRGGDIIQTVRIMSEDATLFKRATSGLFYRLFKALGGVDIPEGAADFRLLDRQAVDALNSLPERVRFVRGLVFWVGFKVETLPYKASARLVGKSKYSTASMLRFALSGITSFTSRPLRLAFPFGAVVTFCAACYALYVLYCRLVGIPLVPGWTSTLLSILFLGGIQLMTLGVASEYLASLYTEAKNRPLYLVRRRDAAARRAEDERDEQ